MVAAGSTCSPHSINHSRASASTTSTSSTTIAKTTRPRSRSRWGHSRTPSRAARRSTPASQTTPPKKPARLQRCCARWVSRSLSTRRATRCSPAPPRRARAVMRKIRSLAYASGSASGSSRSLRSRKGCSRTATSRAFPKNHAPRRTCSSGKTSRRTPATSRRFARSAASPTTAGRASHKWPSHGFCASAS